MEINFPTINMPKKNFNLILENKIDSYKKTINVDSDKSISIRSFLISAISRNISEVKNILESEDVIDTIKSIKKLGVKIKKKAKKNYLIYGNGLGSLQIKKNSSLYLGNSGTLARLLIGILSTTPNLEVNLKGDHSLNKRNMKKLIFLMEKFGASFKPKKKFFFPIKLISSPLPVGINYKAGVSAQLKSAVILAGLNSYGTTKIIENQKSRDHTEKMLVNNSNSIMIKTLKSHKEIKVFGKKEMKKILINVPGDPSSAAFFTALTLVNKNSYLKIKNICLNPTRIGFYELLKKHGAKIKFVNKRKFKNELIGDIEVKSCNLRPIKAGKNYYVNSTDEYPILFIIASFLNGVSIFKGIRDLANKESNRIIEMQKILKQVGVNSLLFKDGIKIFGKGKIDTKNKKIHVPKLGDHRICMSAFILAAVTGIKTVIKNFDTVFTSSPSFLNIMKQFKVKFEIQN